MFSKTWLIYKNTEFLCLLKDECPGDMEGDGQEVFELGEFGPGQGYGVSVNVTSEGTPVYGDTIESEEDASTLNVRLEVDEGSTQMTRFVIKTNAPDLEFYIGGEGTGEEPLRVSTCVVYIYIHVLYKYYFSIK